MTARPAPFPQDFLWGASTAAHQVEGDLINNWSEWEAEHAPRLAREAPSQYRAHSPVWPLIASEATRPSNYRSGQAVHHLRNQKTDIGLMQELGLTAYRFSVEWSRIEPKPGVFDERAIDSYREFVVHLREVGIEPFVTLWHWTVPRWFYHAGDWLHADATKRFTRFTSVVSEAFGDNVRFWITLNEPTVYAHHGYLNGEWPPQERSLRKFERVLGQLRQAHQAAYAQLHAQLPDAQVGIAHQLSWITPRHPRWLNAPAALIADWVANWRFVNSVNRWQDFIGFNYYFHTQIGWGSAHHTHPHRSDMGWELCPEGMGHLLDQLRHYRKPIYITEHGLADRQDTHREWYLRQSLAAIHRAIVQGVNVRGYFHWSLLDNFEWNRGFWPRFGLIQVDRRTQQRTLRPSARQYAAMIRSRSVTT